MEQLFQPYEAEHITRIPVHHYGVKDQMVWNMDKKGLFIIKSAYELTCLIKKKVHNRLQKQAELEMKRGRCGGGYRSSQLNLS